MRDRFMCKVPAWGHKVQVGTAGALALPKRYGAAFRLAPRFYSNQDGFRLQPFRPQSNITWRSSRHP